MDATFGVRPGTILPVCPVFALASKLMRAIWDAEVHSFVDLRVDELSRSNKETMVRRFDCKGLHHLINSFVIITDKDLCSRNVLQLFPLYCYMKSSSMTNPQVHAAQ